MSLYLTLLLFALGIVNTVLCFEIGALKNRVAVLEGEDATAPCGNSCSGRFGG